MATPLRHVRQVLPDEKPPPREPDWAAQTADQIEKVVVSIRSKTSEPLEAVLANVEDAIGSTAKSTLNVLRAATAVALADEGSARILTEQLAMTVAAAALRRRFPAVVADAFLETRLGKPWRTTYGMLDSRFDAKAFINYLCPQI